MEEGLNGLNSLSNKNIFPSDEEIQSELTIPGPKRIFYIADAIRKGWDTEKIYSLTKIDYWFLNQIHELIQIEQNLSNLNINDLDKALLKEIKEKGFSDSRIAEMIGTNEDKIREHRKKEDVML